MWKRYRFCVCVCLSSCTRIHRYCAVCAGEFSGARAERGWLNWIICAGEDRQNLRIMCMNWKGFPTGAIVYVCVAYWKQTKSVYSAHAPLYLYEGEGEDDFKTEDFSCTCYYCQPNTDKHTHNNTDRWEKTSHRIRWLVAVLARNLVCLGSSSVDLFPICSLLGVLLHDGFHVSIVRLLRISCSIENISTDFFSITFAKIWTKRN